MNKEIGGRVKQVRGTLNQRAFAEALGVSLGSVSQIEQGKAMPSGDFLFKIHTVFGTDVNWLFTGMNSAGVATPACSPREQALLDNYRHCDTDGQTAVEQVAFVASKPSQALANSNTHKKAAS